MRETKDNCLLCSDWETLRKKLLGKSRRRFRHYFKVNVKNVEWEGME
jgi:hypothetical protein